MKKKNKTLRIDDNVWNPWEPDNHPVFYAVDPVEPKYFAISKPTTPPTKGVVGGNVGEVDPIQYAKYVNSYNPANLPEPMGVSLVDVSDLCSGDFPM